MTSRFSQPVVCPVMVGREEALENLDRLAAAALSRGQVALISGEAGIGKTRLLAEFLDGRPPAGHEIWRGRFFEQDAESPYSGIRQLIADIAERADGAEDLLTPVASDLRAVAPGLFEAISARGESSEESAAAEFEDRRVRDALARLIKTLRSRSPVVLSFEDVHWADSSSLAAIVELARDETAGCLILMTFRSDERSSALNSVLAALDRERLASEIRLNRLGLAEVDRMLAAMLGSVRATRADVLHLINQLSDGNPFHVEEVTRSLLERAGGMDQLDSVRLSELEVPRGITEAVQRRTQSLSEGAKEVLLLAAVAGLRFDFPLLCGLLGRSEGEALLQIKELMAAQLVVEEAEDTFSFRHALTREAIRSQLLSRERRALSRQVAFAMQTRYGDDAGFVDDLAWHFYEAGEWGLALRYSRKAGERALGLNAPVEARNHLTRAIEAGERLDGATPAEVYRLRGSANEALGMFEPARADYERAAELADQQSEPQVRWQALIDLGLLWAGKDYRRSEPYYRAALGLAREIGEPEVVGHTLNRLGNLACNQGDFESARESSEEALATFREAGNELGVAQTLDLLGMTCLQGMKFGPAVEYYREAIDVLDRQGDKRTLASALSSIQVCAATYQTSMLPPGISLAEGSAFGERGLALARQLGWRSAEAYALWQLAFALGPRGEYARALDCAREGVRLARQIGHTQWEVGALCALGAILIDILAEDEAEDCIRQAEVLCEGMGSSPWEGQVNALLIDARVARRHGASLAPTDDPAPGREADGFGARVLLASRGDLALANGDLESATSILKRLESEAGDAGLGVALRVARLRGRLLAARGDTEAAAKELRMAEDAAQSQGNASFRWRLNADLASLLLTAGDREGARAATGEAMALVDSLARAIPERELADNFIAKAALHLPAVLRGRPGRDRTAVLTAREAEVAKLIANGLTNREIADELVLGVRTVESHVANAMAKLGFTTRSQLAAWAAEHRLLDSGT